MGFKIMLIIIVTFFCLTGCSSIAYVTGYNLVAEKEIEFQEDEKHEKSPKYSHTAHVIAMVETGGGYLRKSPTLVIGIALSPIFFMVGTISGVFAPDEPEIPRENPVGQESKVVAQKRAFPDHKPLITATGK